ncbi:MAG TPA: sulfite exporter TauE/SafE family protein [Ramlibacter sp.]|nr:sulfite exporter TauE/SafE family protein [Ramlibacter sp.]
MTELEIAGVATAFLAAGIVKGITGMGLPTVSIALLGLFMSTGAAATLLVVPLLVTNVMQCVGPHWRSLALRLWPMWVCILLGAWANPLPRVTEGGAVVQLALGIVLMVYAAWSLLQLRLALRCSLPVLLVVAAATGYATGMLAAATGVFVIPMLVLLQALRLDRDEMVQALGLSFTVCTVALAATVGWNDVARTALSPAGWAALLAACAGTLAGARVRGRLDADAFRRWLFGVLGAVGAAMVAKAL